MKGEMCLTSPHFCNFANDPILSYFYPINSHKKIKKPDMEEQD